MKYLITTFLSLATIISACQQATLTNVAVENAAPNYFTEPHRPQFHFSPEKMWMNDPNGMVFFEGEYHLFYQHFPNASVWGPMHWGHAVSRDLVHWEHLPIALYPNSLGYIFSGSAVVDWNNTSGFGENGQPPLVAIFTQHNTAREQAGRNDFQYQSIAYSNDKGRTWKMYEHNPVVPNSEKIRDFRDPKVFWHESSMQWVMVFAAHDHVMLWGAPDLKNWTHLSNFGKEYGTHGGVWECPDLFPITVEGTGEAKWVLLQSLNPGSPNGGSGTQYFVGDFDGKNFTLDPTFEPDVTGGKAVWLDWGRDNYAGVSWSNVPKEDGRRLYLGWMSNWDYATAVPTEVWRSATTLPRSLILKKTDNGYRVFSQPVKELETLRDKLYTIENNIVKGEIDLTNQLGFPPSKMEAILEFELPEGTTPEFGVRLFNAKAEEYRIGFDASQKSFYSDRTKACERRFSNKFAVSRHKAPRASSEKTIRLHLFFDVASCELFADGGAVLMTDIFFPGEDFNKLTLFSSNGEVKLKNAHFYSMKSAVAE